MNQPLATAIATLLYTARIAIDHDGDSVKPGATLALTEKQAKPLLDAKAIELATAGGDGPAAVLSAPELGEISRLNEILDSVEKRLLDSQSDNKDLLAQVQELQAQNESLAGQLESAQTAKASAQSEVAELQVKLNATLDALQEAQSAVAAKGSKKS